MFNVDTSQECTIKMGVESEAKETVQLLPEKVFPFQNLCQDIVEKKPNVPIIKFQQYQVTICFSL